MTENLEQRTGSSSFAGKALRIGAYVAIAALGAAGGYYAGAEKAKIAEQAAQQAEQRAKALEIKLKEQQILQDAYTRALYDDETRQQMKDWHDGQPLMRYEDWSSKKTEKK